MAGGGGKRTTHRGRTGQTRRVIGEWRCSQCGHRIAWNYSYRVEVGPKLAKKQSDEKLKRQKELHRDRCPARLAKEREREREAEKKARERAHEKARKAREREREKEQSAHERRLRAAQEEAQRASPRPRPAPETRPTTESSPAWHQPPPSATTAQVTGRPRPAPPHMAELSEAAGNEPSSRSFGRIGAVLMLVAGAPMACFGLLATLFFGFGLITSPPANPLALVTIIAMGLLLGPVTATLGGLLFALGVRRFIRGPRP